MTIREITPAFKDLMMEDSTFKVKVLKKAIKSKPSLSKAFNKVVHSYVELLDKIKEQNNGWGALNLGPVLGDPSVPYLPFLLIGAHANDPEVIGDLFLNLVEPDKPLKEEIAELEKIVDAYAKLVPEIA